MENKTNTQEFIENYKIDYVKRFFYNDALYHNCVSEKSDIAKIDKLMTITTLENFWEKVKNFTKKVYSDHSIRNWQGLAELRAIQLDLQQNYYYDNNKNEILIKGE